MLPNENMLLERVRDDSRATTLAKALVGWSSAARCKLRELERRMISAYRMLDALRDKMAGSVRRMNADEIYSAILDAMRALNDGDTPLPPEKRR